MSYTADEKVQIITDVFANIDDILNEIRGLSKLKHCDEIAGPEIYSILERLAWFRYRREPLAANDRFKKLLLTYSNNVYEINKIDLAFLYQWDISEHRETPTYKKS